MRELGMYLHIPFCKRKCDYCDFYSICDNELVTPYFQCLNQEIKEVGEGIAFDVKNGYLKPTVIKTIYFGGGTPSFVDSNYITECMNTINECYSLVEKPEVTIEVNPGTVTKEKLEEYRRAGINRLSIGMQSIHNEILKQIGRIHSLEEFLHTYQLAREVGFTNINIDCMIGLPGQSLQQVEETMQKIGELSPEHVSVYSLILEDGTKLEKRVREGKETLPDEDTERKMYWTVKQMLEKNGYIHYEISNFAKPNFESKHNLDCWHQKEYIGMGAGAHSYTEGCRYSNIADVKQYIENYKTDKVEETILFHEKQDKTAMAKEFIILALRTIKGCNKEEFYEKFGYDLEKGFTEELRKLSQEGLIITEGETIALTNRGLDFANLVWQEFI